MGRPTHFDDLRAQKVINAIENGNSRQCAAGLAGVGVRTLHTWMSENPQFRQRVKAADAKAENLVVKALFELATGGEKPHFEALKFWLKTRRAKTWREMQATQVKEEVADLSQVDAEKLWTAVEALKPKKGTGT